MSKPKKVKEQSLMATALQRVGFLKARQAMGFMIQWWISTSVLGRPPESIEEYAEEWSTSRATAFRMQASFRRAFPGYETPTELAAAIGFVPTNLQRSDEKRLTTDAFGWAAP